MTNSPDPNTHIDTELEDLLVTEIHDQVESLLWFDNTGYDGDEGTSESDWKVLVDIFEDVIVAAKKGGYDLIAEMSRFFSGIIRHNEIMKLSEQNRFLLGSLIIGFCSRAANFTDDEGQMCRVLLLNCDLNPFPDLPEGWDKGIIEQKTERKED